VIITTGNLSILKHGKSVGPQVYAFLREQIIEGHLRPGTRISEAEISRELNVSRQPVREAFINLRNDDLVEVRPQRGTFVTKISIAAVNDARFIRGAIEAEIVKLLAVKSTPMMVTELCQQLDLQKKIGTSDYEAFYQLDEKFHRLMAQLAGKATAWNIISRLKAHFDRVRYLSTIEKPLERLIAQHEAIIDGIAQKNPQQAEQAIRAHMHEVVTDLPIVIAKQPELFAEQGTAAHFEAE